MLMCWRCSAAPWSAPGWGRGAAQFHPRRPLAALAIAVLLFLTQAIFSRYEKRVLIPSEIEEDFYAFFGAGARFE
jgi:hypothetical protein